MERRNFLVGTASLGATAIAGCSVLSGDSDGGIPEPLSNVGDWLVAPEESGGQLERHSADAVALSELFDKADRLSGSYVAALHDRYQPQGVDLERDALEHSVFVDPGAGLDFHNVTIGSFDGAEVAGMLEDSGYSSAGARGDYELFTVLDDWAAVADDRLLWSHFGRSGLEEAERTVDAVRSTRSGEDPALFDVEGPHRTVAERLPDGDFASVGLAEPDEDRVGIPGDFEGVVAYGESRGIANEDSGTATAVIEFEDEDAAGSADPEQYVRQENGDLSDLDLEHDVDGTTVTITAEGSRDALP